MSKKQKKQPYTPTSEPQADADGSSNGYRTPPPAPPIPPDPMPATSSVRPPSPKPVPLTPTPHQTIPDPIDPFPLSDGDKENIRLQIAHGNDAHQIGTYSSTVFKYCVFYRGYWYFIAYHVYNKKVISVMPFNILSPDEKQMFFRYKERREIAKQQRTVQKLGDA